MEETQETIVRLAVLMARRGVASRRQAEAMIVAGEVTVNGEVATEPGTKVGPEDHIRVAGRALPPEPPKRYLLLHKPKGVITGRDEEGHRKSVLDLIEELDLRGVMPVGRLDCNTEGALILTNDGDLAHRLTHPSSSIPKRYVAKCYRTPSAADLSTIERGVSFQDGSRSRPAKARVLSQTDQENAWVEITVTDTGYRAVQRILTQLGHPPSKMRRESFATVSIRGMERGEIRELTPEEIARVQDLAAGKKASRAGKNWRKPGFAKPKRR